ncbi:hydroxyacylglutathione hydrolase [Rhodanobacter sp. C03]|uniref:hydroxyacylglutathione hydrolase n=1 Tax=Rhodanobacter sp. C03 TaxID=1945858 RepID=UPI000984BDDD|nr:hydroxyacylglutathione hydrolase [Rhodanobacter sp. C03]OOG56869.1 hydroxyacylglutathione hydrolase [Rhodanobacter sp. C03]
MHLVPLPALLDNYIWLLHDDDGNAIVVDPGDAGVVEHALAARQLRLRAILLTHHHHDHIGGAAELHGQHAAPVYAPDDERIEAATVRVHDGDTIELASPRVRFDVIAIPGHTLSHLAYVGAGLLLCGDTLFSLGCGRLFEGSPAQMLASLDRLSSLPGEILVCGGHEYTETNGRFAHTIEPENPELHQRLQEVSALRAQLRPTLPIALARELATNPFLRVDTDAVAAWCRQHGIDSDRVARFAAVRAAKDEFC